MAAVPAPWFIRFTPSEEKLPGLFSGRMVAAAPEGSIAAIRVFGSRARGASGPGSALDVAVELTAPTHRDTVHHLAAALAFDCTEALDLHELGFAPVVLPPGAQTGLRSAIARDGVEIWRAAA